MRWPLLLPPLFLALAAPARAQDEPQVRVQNDSVSLRLLNTDLRVAIQAIARFLDRPVLFGNLGDYRITMETPQPVPRSTLTEILRGMLRTHGLELQTDSSFYSIGMPQPVQAEAQPARAGPLQLFVVHLRHARAVDVAATVNAIYGRASAIGEIGAPRPTLPDALREHLVPPAERAVPDAPQPVIQAVAELKGDVTIVPDLRTNNLLVRASSDDFELIQAAVQQLDVRPLQVLIEVVIAEVRRDRSLAFGLSALFQGDHFEGSTAGLSAGDFVLTLMRTGNVDITATLTAAASRGDAAILSRPVLLATNNESAEMLVGSQRPFIQVQRALPTDAPVRDQVVQYKDVGTRLGVRPTISEDGYVMMHVTQEVNVATAEIAFDAPVISTRTIATQLLVKDGHTAVLGGLVDQQKDVTRAGVPLLSALPVLGGLFGRHAKRSSETELFVFLTPRVIRSDDDLDQASQAAGERTRKLRENLFQWPRGDSQRDSATTSSPIR